jgi:hypothetical protein
MSVEAFLFFALAVVYCAISFPSHPRRRLVRKEQKQPCHIDRVRTARHRYSKVVGR